MSILKPAISNTDHIQGNKDSAKIELLEFGDYQCPYCGEAFSILYKIQQKLGDKLLFVFRNFPLQEAHPNAYDAALAAEAAALQGKFWEMHDLLYENQENLDSESLVRYADYLKLNLNQFKNDIENGDLNTKIDADIESGFRSGVNGTPSFYVNGTKYDGDWGYEPFLEYLQSLI